MSFIVVFVLRLDCHTEVPINWCGKYSRHATRRCNFACNHHFLSIKFSSIFSHLLKTISQKMDSSHSLCSLPSFADTFMLQLKDSKQKDDFETFCMTTKSLWTMIFLAGFTLAFASNFYITALVDGGFRSPYMKALVVMTGVWVGTFAALVYFIFKQKERYSKFLQNFIMFLSAFGMSLSVLYRATGGRCDDSLEINVWTCNPEHNSHALPQDMMIAAMIYPLIFPLILKSINFTTVVASWVSVIATITAAILVTNSYNSWTSLIIYFPLSLFLICDIQRQNLFSYFGYCKQKWLLAENERLAEENRANELRHMIGNVAHDLKTVRFFFILCFVGELIVLFLCFKTATRRNFSTESM